MVKQLHSTTQAAANYQGQIGTKFSVLKTTCSSFYLHGTNGFKHWEHCSIINHIVDSVHCTAITNTLQSIYIPKKKKKNPKNKQTRVLTTEISSLHVIFPLSPILLTKLVLKNRLRREPIMFTIIKIQNKLSVSTQTGLAKPRGHICTMTHTTSRSGAHAFLASQFPRGIRRK